MKHPELMLAWPLMALALFGNVDLAQGSPQLRSLLNPFDDCRKAKQDFNDRDVCAIMFDDEDCEGWNLQVGQGYTQLGFRNRNDAESLMVRAGCILVGYDHDGQTVAERGDAVAFDALGRSRDDHLVVDDLTDEQLDEEISAVLCQCGVQGTNTVSPLPGRGGCGGGCSKKCNRYLGQFNRPDLDRQEYCAILFDDDDCDGWHLPVKKGYTALSFFRKNDAESVMVRPGCKLVGYDHDDSNVRNRGNKVVMDASSMPRSGPPLQKNLVGSSDLREEISSLDCTC